MKTTNPRKLLLHYMKEKSDFIENLTGIKLYIESDYNWARTLHKRDLEKILYKIGQETPFFDSHVCPQCIIFNDENHDCIDLYGCSKCVYASTHKKCPCDYSTYDKIITELQTTLVYVIGKKTLKLYFKWNK